MLISKYLNQRCTLTVRSDEPLKYDRYGNPQEEESITIPCRKETLVVDVQTPAGIIKKSKSNYFLDRKPGELDLIDGNPILQINGWVDYGGGVQGYKVII